MAAYAMEAMIRGRAALGVAVAASAGLFVLLLLDLVGPPNIPLGALVLLIVGVCSLLLDAQLLIVIVALAAITRAADAALGDIPPGLAALECASFVFAAALGLVFRRATDGAVRATSTREPQTTAPAEVPTIRALDGVPLTDREREVLHMAMQGLTAAQVAERLFISKRTVETHLERAYGKLGVRSKRELIASAFDQAQSARSS